MDFANITVLMKKALSSINNIEYFRKLVNDAMKIDNQKESLN